MKKIPVSNVITSNMLVKAGQCLADNGVDPDEVGVVLQALGYILLDTELDCEELTV